MDKTDYIKEAITTFNSIVLKVARMSIVDPTISFTMIDIVFALPKKLTVKNIDTIQAEIAKSQFNNWILFFDLNDKKGYYYYKFRNYGLKTDVKKYIRVKGLKSLINE